MVRRGGVTTTYARNFSPLRSSRGPALGRTMNNFAYSGFRRELENSHVQAPFHWENWEYAGSHNSQQGDRKRDARTSARNERQTIRGMKQKEEASRCPVHSCHQAGSAGSGSCTDQSSDWMVPMRESVRTSQPKENKKQQHSRAEKVYEKPWRQERRPQTAPPIVELHRNQTPLPKRHSSMRASAEEPPFIPYGMNNTTVKTGGKKTHNVLATSTEIYPSARLAQRRQKVQVENAQEEARSAPYREKRRLASFNDLTRNEYDTWMRKQTSEWQSEYHRQFPGYERTEYAKRRM